MDLENVDVLIESLSKIRERKTSGISRSWRKRAWRSGEKNERSAWREKGDRKAGKSEGSADWGCEGIVTFKHT